MPYTWTTQIHNNTADCDNIQVELWTHMAQGWENLNIHCADTMGDACEIVRSLRTSAYLDGVKRPMIIAAVRFAPREHHRLGTWYGTYSEGDTDA